MSETQPAVAAGQIWQENDPRHPRYVLVTAVGSDYARIISCNENGQRLPYARPSRAKLTRFNGKRSGYKFVRAAGIHETEGGER